MLGFHELCELLVEEAPENAVLVEVRLFVCSFLLVDLTKLFCRGFLACEMQELSVNQAVCAFTISIHWRDKCPDGVRVESLRVDEHIDSVRQYFWNLKLSNLARLLLPGSLLSLEQILAERVTRLVDANLLLLKCRKR